MLNMFRRFLLWPALIALIPAVSLAQSEGEEPPPSYTYYVPFPESTFRGDWQFRLDLSPDLDRADDREAVELSLFGYDLLGERVLSGEPVSLSAHGVFRWQEIDAFADVRLQSLTVVSDAPLTGVLWMWSDPLGLFNAVSLIQKPAARLVMPHIPSDFFAWRSSFVVQGVSEENRFGDVIFGYYHDQTEYNENGVWLGLEPNGYLTGTPFHDIIIGELGEEPSLEWGAVRSATPGYLLAGYQTYLRVEDNVQSGAIELTEQGSPQGFLGLSRHADWIFQDWLAVTNPNGERVNVEFVLNYLPPAASEEDVPKMATAVENITLSQYDRLNYVLGSNLFAEVEGDFISLSYRAAALTIEEGEEEPRPMPIYTVHFQSDDLTTALGAHLPQSLLGSQSTAWINLDDDFETQLEIYAPENRETVVKMSVYDAQGQPLFVEMIEFNERNIRHALNSQMMRDKAIALAQGEEEGGEPVAVDLTGVFRIELDRQSGGLFFTKKSGFRETDFSVVNPALRFVREVPDFKK